MFVLYRHGSPPDPAAFFILFWGGGLFAVPSAQVCCDTFYYDHSRGQNKFDIMACQGPASGDGFVSSLVVVVVRTVDGIPTRLNVKLQHKEVVFIL